MPRIGNGLDGAIQSEATVYVGHVSIDIVADVVIGVILSLLGLLNHLALCAHRRTLAAKATAAMSHPDDDVGLDEAGSDGGSETDMGVDDVGAAEVEVEVDDVEVDVLGVGVLEVGPVEVGGDVVGEEDVGEDVVSVGVGVGVGTTAA